MNEKLIQEYIGKDAQKYMNSNTNFIAAVLGQTIGPVWFFYRKSYLLGFAFIIITLILGRISSALNMKEAYSIMFLIYLFSANKLYLWDVRRKVNKIAQTNENMSQEELVDIVRQKGGTNALAATIYVIIVVALIAVLYAMIFYTITNYLSHY